MTGFREFTVRNGGAPQRVFRRVGLSEEQLIDINEPIDLGSYVRMLEWAALDTGNHNFGLCYGRQFKPDMLGLLGAVAIYSSTLGAALANLATLFRYHQQATLASFTRSEGLARLEYRILDGGIVDRRHDAELKIGIFLNVIRHCLGQRWTPDAVHFEHPSPGDCSEHQQAFGAPAYFGQRTNALLFRRDQLHQIMPRGDLHRANSSCAHLTKVGGGNGVLTLLDRVKGEIRGLLPEGIPHIDTIADAIGMRRWTLQRRLSDYGLHFSDVVDLVRRELAGRHIRQRYVPLADIGHILGYSEFSSFSRAFRRWFSVSPQRYRANVGI